MINKKKAENILAANRLEIDREKGLISIREQLKPSYLYNCLHFAEVEFILNINTGQRHRLKKKELLMPCMVHDQTSYYFKGDVERLLRAMRKEIVWRIDYKSVK